MRLFGFDIQRREEAAETQTQTQITTGVNIRGKMVYAGSEHSSMSVPAFFRAINMRADTMARITAQYQRKTSYGNFTEDMGPTRGANINYLLQVEPNPYMSASTFWRQEEIIRLMKGNAYVYVEIGKDEELKALWLCTEGNYDFQTDSYYLNYTMGTMVKSVVAPANRVLHFRAHTKAGQFYGESLLQYGARTLNLAATQTELALDTMAKGGRKKLILQEQPQATQGIGGPKKDQMQKIAKRANEDLPNSDVTYISNVANVTDISQSLTELEFSTIKRMSVIDIANLTGVPRVFLNDDTNINYKSSESATLDLYNNCIAPEIAEIEDEMNRKMLGRDEFGKHRFHLCENSLFRLDREAQAAWNKNRMETGVVSINELRAEQELPPVENGDDHYVSTNLAVAGSEKLKGTTNVKEK